MPIPFLIQERTAGDEESPLPDEGFCVALEYGLPPTGGWGLGVDRLVMLLSGLEHMRDVISFPFVRPKSDTMDGVQVEEDVSKSDASNQ